jgi:energy-coupling factor transporter ATP-binding protein EcfA2
MGKQMSIELRDISYGPLKGVSAWAPQGAIIGVVGEKGSGTSDLLRLMAGLAQPESGEVFAPENRRFVGESDPVTPAPVDVLAIDNALSKYDALVRARTFVGLDRLRKSGATVVIASNEEDLLERLCDEIWWINDGSVAAKGDPRETLRKYRAHIGRKFQAWSETLKARLDPSDRRGDQRAQIKTLQLLSSKGVPSLVWQSGEEVGVGISVEFTADVDNPVIGILIRTRIGFEAYGTTTELEGIKLGPTAAGQTRRVLFQFRCDLCPGDYTLTATSQDESGVVQDMIEDALSFTVTDVRKTPGIVNLRARVAVE